MKCDKYNKIFWDFKAVKELHFLEPFLRMVPDYFAALVYQKAKIFAPSCFLYGMAII